MSDEDWQAREWVCSYCETRYAEYVNGCPRCHFGETGTSSSVRLWPMGLTTEERQVFWAFWDTVKTEYVSKMAAAGGAFVAGMAHRDKRIAELEATVFNLTREAVQDLRAIFYHPDEAASSLKDLSKWCYRLETAEAARSKG